MQSPVRTLCCFLALFAALAVPARSAETPPEEARVRSLLEAKLGFPEYAFSSAAFPTAAFNAPGAGLYTVRSTFYDAGYHVVETAAKPGPYAAVVEVSPGPAGHSMRRYFTLFRLKSEVRPGQKLEGDTAAELERLTGIRRDVATRQAQLIDEATKSRTQAELAADPRFGRLLAGLWFSKPGKDPVRKWNDAWAQERQWWVGLKRHLTGMDRLYPQPFEGPRIVKAPEARTVHEGSLAEAGMKPDAAEKIDAVCRTWAADDDQAFAVCVVRHGVIVLHKAYGERDGRPMTVDTKSWMASATKTMSASLMLQLIDRGLVGIDDRVDKYVPALRGLEVPKPLTIRHLYTHTSGLFQWPGWNDEPADVEQRIADYYPWLAVGNEWGYTGTGNTLGSKIIELISGEALPQFYHRHLLQPLGMEHTDVTGSHADTYSTPLDMARFAQMLLNRGSYGRYRFFSEQTFQQMLPQKLTLLLGPDTKKTFGFGLDGTPERFGHGTASAATFSVDAGEDLVVIMTRNHQGKNQDRYNGKFWDAIHAGIDQPRGAK